MKAMAIKKDQTRAEATANFQAMGSYGATHAMTTSSSIIRRCLSINRSLTVKHTGSKRSPPGNTSEIRGIPTGSNCRIDPASERNRRPKVAN